MKRHLFLFSFIILSITFSLFSNTAYAAKGTLKGNIKDVVTGDPLIGASIAIDGTSFGAATDLDGNYVIHNLPTGTYTVKVRYLGYTAIDKSGVVINESKNNVLNFEMSPESILEQEVIVSVQAKGQMAAINQERAASGIVNIVSSDKIKEVPDATAAESIGRLPGVSLQRSGGEGSKVAIRGLSPQFANIEIDGIRMSGTGLDRGVSLSTISPEMLDGIELSKSLTADKDADAIGGVVNLRTRVAEDSLHYSALARGGYNNLENEFGDYKVAASISNRFFNNKFGVLLNLSNERVNRSSDRFNSSYGTDEIAFTSAEDQRYVIYPNNANIEEQKSIRHRTNGNIVFDYKTDFMKIVFNNIFSKMGMENENRNSQFRFSDDDYRMVANRTKPVEQMRRHSVDAEFKILNTELNITYAYSKDNWEDYIDSYEFEDPDPFTINNDPTSPNYGQKYQGITKDDRYGEHPKDLINRFYALGEYSLPVLRNNRRDTNMRSDITNVINIDWQIPYAIGDYISGKVKVGFKHSNKTRESDKNRVNSRFYAGSIALGRMDNIWYQLYPDMPRYTDFSSDGITMPQGIPGYDFIDEDYDYGKMLNGEYDMSWSPDLDKLQEYHNAYYNYETNTQKFDGDGIESSKNDFYMTEKLTAGYLMAEVNIGKRIKLLPGVRFEQMKTEYNSAYIKENTFAPDGIMVPPGVVEVSVKDRINQHFFPSLNAKYEATNWLDVRAAYYKSTSRPNFDMLSPGIVTDVDYEDMRGYNPYLRPSTAHNIDAGVSFFTNKIGLFSINYFHKELTDLLYKMPRYKARWFDEIIPGDNIEAGEMPVSLYESLQKPRALYPEEWFAEGKANLPDYPINNPNKATIDGVELSWQTNFWYLPGLLSGLVLDLNYTFITSKYYVPFIDFRTEEKIIPPFPIPIEVDVPIYAIEETIMPDQPNSIFNARVGWDHKGFSSRLSFRYETESQVNLDPARDLQNEYRAAIFRMDVNLVQKLKHGFSISLDIMNVTNQMDRNFYRAYNEYTSSYEEYNRKFEHYGITAQLGVKYNF